MEDTIDCSVLRRAGNFEHRCVIRHELGYYGNLIVGAIYRIKEPAESSLRNVLIPALKYCIIKHPFLGAAIQDPGSETPIFVRPDYIQLDRHLQLLETVKSSSSAEQDFQVLKDYLIKLIDVPAPYQKGIPPWRLIVLPLALEEAHTADSFWAFFSYSHSHGDGKSGMAFHRSFLQGLQQSSTTAISSQVDTTISTHSLPPLPPSLESAAALTITWSYLLSPLFGAYLPRFLSSALGLSTSHSGSDATAWKALPCSFDPSRHLTGIELITLNASKLAQLLKTCRAKDAKLTGFLHQAIVHALSTQLTLRGLCNNDNATFIATTPLDLRNLVPAHNTGNTFINCVSAANETLLAPPTSTISSSSPKTITITETTWTHAKTTSKYLATRANTLTDQPIGLLAYLSNYKRYMLNQLGSPRGESYEISNLGTFLPLPRDLLDPIATEARKQDLGFGVNVETREEGVEIVDMVFAQPANVAGPALNFNVVSTAAAGLMVTVTWQKGVLGVEDEDGFVRAVCAEVEAFVREACRG